MDALNIKDVLLFLSVILIFSCSSEKGTKTKSLPQNVDTRAKETTRADDKNEIRNMNGTIVFKELEGGFYGIEADDGKKYNPINLNKQYQKDGLRIKFDAKVKRGMVGIHMWGEYVEILKIEKLDQE
jgi:hypothetical protein